MYSGCLYGCLYGCVYGCVYAGVLVLSTDEAMVVAVVGDGEAVLKVCARCPGRKRGRERRRD